MHIAFYAPLKSPDHPVPSGDRLMARMLIGALQAAGHEVAVASQLRVFLREAEDRGALAALTAEAAAERERLAGEWARAAPDLWFCYHPYYKSPDLIGPPLCARFGVPMVTAEASWSARRGLGVWAQTQALVLDGLRAAAVNICMTGRDAAGLRSADPDLRLARLRPFIGTEAFDAAPMPETGHLVTVAMMRTGDKLDSYRHLAASLARLPHLPWRLTVIGDGPQRAEVQALFAALPQERLVRAGELPPAQVAEQLARAAVYLWPGCGEAYGLAYLEAQAAGLPVVAFRTAGVPEVVAEGETGLLVLPGDVGALANAVERLLTDDALRARMATAARERVRRDHSAPGAAVRLQAILAAALGPR